MSEISKKDAEAIIDLANQADSALHKSLQIAKDSMSEIEYAGYAETVANIMVSIQIDMLKIIVEKFPEFDTYGYFKKK